MKCIKCGLEMRKDDVDFNFKGNYDIYWECDHCEDIGAIQKVRYGKTCKITFTDGIISHDKVITGYKMKEYLNNENE